MKAYRSRLGRLETPRGKRASARVCPRCGAGRSGRRDGAAYEARFDDEGLDEPECLTCGRRRVYVAEFDKQG